MSVIKGLKHTDGQIIVINNFSIKGADSQSDEHKREGEIQATMYKSGAQALRDQNGILDEYEKVLQKCWIIEDVLSKMNEKSTLSQGEALWKLVYNFVLSKIGPGWSEII